MSGVEVVTRTQKIIVLPSTSASIVKQGPDGPPGPQGPPGPIGPPGGPPGPTGPMGPSVITAVVDEQPTWDPNAANNDAAFASACQEAFDAGGGAVLLPRLLKIDAPAVVPHSVDLIGLGGLPGTHAASEIFCVSAGSGIRFGLDTAFLGIVGSGGSRSGGFRVNGNHIALLPMRCASGSRKYSKIVVENSAQDGLEIAATQNSLFEMVEVNSSDRDNFVLDKGAGANHFVKCESHTAGRSHLAFRATGVGAGGVAYPLFNVIDNMIMEYTESTSGPMVQHGAGLMNRLVNCQIVSDHPLITMIDPAIVRIAKDYVVASEPQISIMVLDSSHIQSNGGDADLAGIDVGGEAELYLIGSLGVAGVGIMLRTATGAIVHDESTTTFIGISPFIRLDGNEFTIRRATRTRMLSTRPASELAHQVLQDGDSIARYNLYGNGTIWYSPGNAGIDTNWYRKASGCVGTDQTIGTGTFATGALPAAATVGAGAMAYDTTLQKPVWSNGSLWKDVLASAQTVNAQTGTTYTLVAADAGKLVTLSNAAAITLTVPQDSDATILVGTYIDLMTLGAGQVTVVAGAGATLRVSGLTAKTRAQYSRFGLQKIAANTWSLFGDLAAS